MALVRRTSGLVLAAALTHLLVACGSDDPKKTADYSGAELYINEVQASNQVTVRDENDEADDWIELYNAGSKDIDLTDFFISDDPSNPTKYKLPAGVTVPGGGFEILWADGTPTQGAAHLPFKLSASGESALISDPSGAELDAMDFPAWSADTAGYSYARHPDGTGTFDWCGVPTPKTANGDACATPPAGTGGTTGTGTSTAAAGSNSGAGGTSGVGGATI